MHIFVEKFHLLFDRSKTQWNFQSINNSHFDIFSFSQFFHPNSRLIVEKHYSRSTYWQCVDERIDLMWCFRVRILCKQKYCYFGTSIFLIHLFLINILFSSGFLLSFLPLRRPIWQQIIDPEAGTWQRRLYRHTKCDSQHEYLYNCVNL